MLFTNCIDDLFIDLFSDRSPKFITKLIDKSCWHLWRGWRRLNRWLWWRMLDGW